MCYILSFFKLTAAPLVFIILVLFLLRHFFSLLKGTFYCVVVLYSLKIQSLISLFFFFFVGAFCKIVSSLAKSLTSFQVRSFRRGRERGEGEIQFQKMMGSKKHYFYFFFGQKRSA